MRIFDLLSCADAGAAKAASTIIPSAIAAEKVL